MRACAMVCASVLLALLVVREASAITASDLIKEQAAKLQGVSTKSCNEAVLHWSLPSRKKYQACALDRVSKGKGGGCLDWMRFAQLYTRSTPEYTAAVREAKQRGSSDGVCEEGFGAWWFLGPFPVSKHEIDGDPVWDKGGPLKVPHDVVMLSELSDHGTVTWSLLPESRQGIRLDPPVRWQTLVSTLGSMPVMEWQGWVMADFAILEDGNYLIQCLGLRSFHIDNQTARPGNVYGQQQYWWSVRLAAGIHTLTAHVKAKAQKLVQCRLSTSLPKEKRDTQGWTVHPPSMLPDLIEGFLVSGAIPLPIHNYDPENWLRDVKVSITGRQWPLDQTVYDIAPGQLHVMVTELTMTPTLTGVGTIHAVSCPATPELRIQPRGRTAIKMALTVRCRKRTNEAFIFTFVDHDGSVQQAAAIPPRKGCRNADNQPIKCGVLLTFHGTGVSPQQHAESYKIMNTAGEWEFGFNDMWVLAPTRHGAHNWEGVAQMTAIASIHHLGYLSTHPIFCDNYPDDCARKADVANIAIGGHSMGGHGAWVFSVLNPDVVRALVAGAGWLTKEEYGDSNAWFAHDISKSFVDPHMKGLLESSFTEYSVDFHASNLKGIPVMARVGADDQTVHPFFQRKMRRVLSSFGVDVQAKELPEKQHWWWDTYTTNDGGANFDGDIRDFFATHLKSSPEASSTSTSGSQTEEFEMTLLNPASFDGKGGIRVWQLVRPFHKATIRVTLHHGNHSAVITTSNVRVVEFYRRQAAWNWTDADVIIDGHHIPREEMQDLTKAPFCRRCLHDVRRCVWGKCDNETVAAFAAGDQRGPTTHGPVRRITEWPFVVVVGTGGDPTENDAMLQLAVYIANTFVLTSDSTAPILLDREVQAKTIAEHNIIAVGGAAHNSHVLSLQGLSSTPVSEHTPIEACSSVEACTVPTAPLSFTVGDCTFSDPSNAIIYLTKHGKGRLTLVLSGNSVDALSTLVEGLATPTIPPMARQPFSNMIPDYMVIGPDFRPRGVGGVLCTGYWGNVWEHRTDLASGCDCQLY